MKLRNRNLGYLVLGGLAFFLFLFFSASHSRKTQDVLPAPQVVSAPDAQIDKNQTEANSQKSITSPLPRVPQDVRLSTNKAILKMKKSGLVDYWISPDGNAALVYVEPQCWAPLLHKDKVSFVMMFVTFFMAHNEDRPQSSQIPFFIIKNMSTKERLARGFVKPYVGVDSPFEIFK